MRLAAASSVSAAVLCAARLLGCGSPGPVNSPPAPVFPEAGSMEVAPTDECSAMCATLGRLGCPEALIPTEVVDGSVVYGRSCASSCTVAGRHLRDVKPECVAGAKSPDEVRACCPTGFGCTPVRCAGR